LKPIIIDMKDLSESTMIFEKKPNPAIVWFVYILLGITVISILFMAVSKIDIVTESTGVIYTAEGLTEVQCNYNAKITKCNVQDGQYVRSGTILLELGDLPNEKNIQEDLEELQKTQDNLAILKAYDTFLNSDAAKINELDPTEFDSMTDNRFFEEFQTRKKLFLNQLTEVERNIISFSNTLLNEKSNVYKEIQSLETTYEELSQRIPPENFVNGQLVIRAKSSGYFYSLDNLEVGDTLSEESHIGDIYPDQQKTFQAQLFVLTPDIGKIHEGLEVKLEIDAFPSREYGTLTGHIRKIAKVANFKQDQNVSYFPVWVDCDTAELTNKNGESTTLKSGLMCNAKIVTGKKSILQYVLDSIH